MNNTAARPRNVQLFVEGQWQDGESTTILTDKYDGQPVAYVHEVGREQLEAGLAALDRAWQEVEFPHYRRFEVLSRASERLTGRRAEFVDAIVTDTGFSIGDAEREVDRATQTLLISGEEAKRIHGEVVPLHGAPGATGRIAFTLRFPLGVVAAITPFNSPLNTVVHKVAPALAAGNSVALKPAAATPITANLLIDLLLDAGLPPELIGLFNGGGSTVGQWILESPVPAFYAFTGSTQVGEHIRATVGLRRAQLELGSLSSTIVCADGNLDKAVQSVVGAAFRKAGQVCTSVQRLYVDETVMDEVASNIAQEVASRSVGDPRSPGAFVGPVISEHEATRISSWVNQAVDDGASVVSGGGCSGAVVTPTVLSRVPSTSDVFCKEVFGPVVSLVGFRNLETVMADINDTPYGLAAGIFTSDISVALTAAERLRMGSVHINETSSSRVDLMPYGGVKASGSGVEGPRYAIEEMTEQRLVSIGRP